MTQSMRTGQRRAWRIAILFWAVVMLAAPVASALLACDVDDSGNVDVYDVQLTINAALRIPLPPGTAPDLDYSGFVDALDVQLSINGALRLVVDADGDGVCDAANANLLTSVTSFAINSGADTAADRSVYLNNTCTGSPTHYMASEAANFAGAAWQAYSPSPLFVLSEGNGTKTIYFKVKKIVKASEVVTDTIALSYTPVAPTLQSFSVNNDTPATVGRTVVLNNICVGGPDEYLASESPAFTEAVWQPYSSAPLFALTTAGNGFKTVYFKTRNSIGESGVLSDQILLSEPVAPTVTAFSLNNGDAVTESRTVALNNTCIDSPTQYMASISSSFSGATWQAYAAAPSFTLPSGNGVKTVYFKTRNPNGESNVMQDDIELTELHLAWGRNVFDLSRRNGHAALTFGGKLWVLGGKGNDGALLNDVWSSIDGVTWNLETPAAQWTARSGHAAVVFSGRIYVIGGFSAAGARRDVWSSDNGVAWVAETTQAQWSARSTHAAVAFDGKLWVLGGFDNLGNRVNDVWYSANGVQWTQKTGAADWSGRDNLTAAVTGEGTANARMWVIGGSTAAETPTSEVWSSADGATWTLATATPGWEARFSHASVVASTGLMWVFGGVGINDKHLNDAWYSSDGSFWTKATGLTGAGWSGRGKHAAVTSGDVLWVIGGEDTNSQSLRDAWRSTDGSTWTRANMSAQWDARQDHASVVSSGPIGSYMWVLGGRDDNEKRFRDVWYSADGAVWAQATPAAGWTARAGLAATATGDGKLWVFGGSTDVRPSAVVNDVWYSTDGTTWLRQTAAAEWAARAYHAAAAFQNKLWVVGGVDATGTPLNDVWSSDNGVTWTSMGNVNWPARQRHALVVFDNKLWVIGGMDANWAPFNDAWSSDNGITWIKTAGTSGAPWLARAGAGVTVFDSKLWVIAGGRYNNMSGLWTTYADAWFSTNGQTWTQALVSGASPSGRYGVTAAAYNDQLWLLGGLPAGVPVEVWNATIVP